MASGCGQSPSRPAAASGLGSRWAQLDRDAALPLHTESGESAPLQAASQGPWSENTLRFQTLLLSPTSTQPQHLGSSYPQGSGGLGAVPRASGCQGLLSVQTRELPPIPSPGAAQKSPSSPHPQAGFHSGLAFLFLSIVVVDTESSLQGWAILLTPEDLCFLLLSMDL